MATLGITGITGLNTDRFRVVLQPEAAPAGVHGNAVDPKHTQTGETAEPYPWIEFLGPHGPYGPAESDLLSELPESRTLPAGEIVQDPSGDQTPYYTHGGPNIPGLLFNRETGPNHLPDGASSYLEKSRLAHGVRTNAGEKGRQSSNPENDPWTSFYEPIQGEDLLTNDRVRDGQVGPSAFGYGVNDHMSNDFPKVNSYGFNTAHRMRRYSTNVVPGNWMWLNPGGRPLHKTMPHSAYPPTGDGPFSGQDATYGYGIEGAILMDSATEYVAPPQPKVVPAVQAYDDVSPVVELW